MTQDEYDNWIAKMHLLGDLERQRQADERADPNGLKQFLAFLEQVNAMMRKSDHPIFDEMSETNVRIARQRILAKYPLK
jgi:hypothetical protein